MRLLLDTHALLWALTRPNRLSARARELITDRANTLVVSAVSGWELSTKHRLGKLASAESLVLAYPEYVRRLGIEELPISSRHAMAAGGLPWDHRDPFDRMLAAQSVLEATPLVTADAVFAELAGLSTVW